MPSAGLFARTKFGVRSGSEKRRIQINYPGSGNCTVFSYDGLDRNTSIQEFRSGTLSSTKQFVWCGYDRCESRNAAGVLLSQFFDLGQTISGANYFYQKDILGSIVQLADSSGNLQAQYSYTPYGQVQILSGSLQSDYQFANFYSHQPSGLLLAVHRGYNANLERWISRDPIQSPNLYAYVGNSPLMFTDPMGLDKDGRPKFVTDPGGWVNFQINKGGAKYLKTNCPDLSPSEIQTILNAAKAGAVGAIAENPGTIYRYSTAGAMMPGKAAINGFIGVFKKTKPLKSPYPTCVKDLTPGEIGYLRGFASKKLPPDVDKKVQDCLDKLLSTSH